jgi:hypothetical protein
MHRQTTQGTQPRRSRVRLRTRHVRLGATPLTHVGAHVYIAGSNCMCCLTSSVASFLARLAPGLGGREDVLAAAAALVPVLGMLAVAEVAAGAELACAPPNNPRYPTPTVTGAALHAGYHSRRHPSCARRGAHAACSFQLYVLPYLERCILPRSLSSIRAACVAWPSICYLACSLLSKFESACQAASRRARGGGGSVGAGVGRGCGGGSRRRFHLCTAAQPKVSNLDVHG